MGEGFGTISFVFRAKHPGYVRGECSFSAWGSLKTGQSGNFADEVFFAGQEPYEEADGLKSSAFFSIHKRASPSGFTFFMESLILAQDERLRRA